jgi:hypothetical protein
MTILKEVVAELIGMFVGDIRVTLAILVVVAAAAALIDLAGVDPLLGGGVLLCGCLAILIAGVTLAARRQRAASRAEKTQDHPRRRAT